jgi:hypothetical protein
MVTITIRIENKEPTIWFKVQDRSEGVNLIGAKMIQEQLDEKIRQAEGIDEALNTTEQ